MLWLLLLSYTFFCSVQNSQCVKWTLIYIYNFVHHLMLSILCVFCSNNGRERERKKKTLHTNVYLFLFKFNTNEISRNEGNNNIAIHLPISNFIAYVDVVVSIVMTALLSLSTFYPSAFPFRSLFLCATRTHLQARHWTNKMKMCGNFFVFVLIFHTLLAHQCPILTDTSMVFKNDFSSFTSFLSVVSAPLSLPLL